MKAIFNIKNIIGVASILLVTASCDDFLDTPPNHLLGSDGFYQSPSQSEQGIIGVYAGLREFANEEFLNLSEFRSDNAWVQPIPNAYREYAEIGTFRAGEDLAMTNNVWNRWYKVIYDANVALAKIPDCDFGNFDAMKDQFLGEVHFLRGWAYFELARLYGNVPLINVPVSPADAKNIPQSSARTIYDEIVLPDLIAAKNKLPLSADLVDSNNKSVARSSGRVDKIAAQAMLARVYMTMAGFPLNDTNAKGLAETELKAVIAFSESNGNKYWVPDSIEWRKQFMPTDDYYNKYPIFSIQYRAGGTGNSAIFNFSPALPTSYTSQRIMGNNVYVEKSLMYEFDKTYTSTGSALRDARGHDYSILTGFDPEDGYPDGYSQTTEELELPDGSKVDVFTNTMFYKFLPTKRKIEALGMSIAPEANMKDYNDWPVNYPVIRYEDILLMYAEILAEKDIAGAVKIVNRIRERVGCDPVSATTSAQALEFVKRERRIELMGEGVRWFDLVRWNEWKPTIINMFNSYNNPDGTDVANVKDGRYLYPIPLAQINVRPGFYEQNEGYK